MKISLVQGSLTDGDETLLVNASNTNLKLGSGVSGAIRHACGAGYQEHILELLQKKRGGPIEPGEVLITDAGAHATARYVAHVAVMDYRGGGFSGSSFPTLEVIRRGYTNLWKAIDTLGGDVSVAMVALGAGTGQLGVRDPIAIACETLVASGAKRIERVTFYGYGFIDFTAIADVVTRTFPEPWETLSPEMREHITSMRTRV